LLGEPLQIRLLALVGSEEVDFDDVRLFQTSDLINLHEDMIINFKDFAVLGNWFLDEEMFP